jgi:hypothetical protein
MSEEITTKLVRITPERRRIANIFKTHVEAAVYELGPGYTVDLQGNFYDIPHAPNHRNLSKLTT